MACRHQDRPWTEAELDAVVAMRRDGEPSALIAQRLGRTVQAADWSAGAAVLTKIRVMVALNLGLGVLTVLVIRLGVPS